MCQAVTQTGLVVDALQHLRQPLSTPIVKAQVDYSLASVVQHTGGLLLYSPAAAEGRQAAIGRTCRICRTPARTQTVATHLD